MLARRTVQETKTRARASNRCTTSLYLVPHVAMQSCHGERSEPTSVTSAIRATAGARKGRGQLLAMRRCTYIHVGAALATGPYGGANRKSKRDHSAQHIPPAPPVDYLQNLRPVSGVGVSPIVSERRRHSGRVGTSRSTHVSVYKQPAEDFSHTVSDELLAQATVSWFG